MSELIAPGKVVTIEYVLHDGKGKERDRSKEDAPMQYLHGARNIVPGLEAKLESKKVGDEFVAVVSPAEGYGEPRGLKPVRMPRSSFPKDADLSRGVGFTSKTQDGRSFPLWVTKVQGPTVICSAEHPMAGVELHFSVKVLDIRDASEEEVAHGHVHGPGGHGH